MSIGKQQVKLKSILLNCKFLKNVENSQQISVCISSMGLETNNLSQGKYLCEKGKLHFVFHIQS